MLAGGGGQPTYGKFHMFCRFYFWKLPLLPVIFTERHISHPVSCADPNPDNSSTPSSLLCRAIPHMSTIQKFVEFYLSSLLISTRATNQNAQNSTLWIQPITFHHLSLFSIFFQFVFIIKSVKQQYPDYLWTIIKSVSK